MCTHDWARPRETHFPCGRRCAADRSIAVFCIDVKLFLRRLQPCSWTCRVRLLWDAKLVTRLGLLIYSANAASFGALTGKTSASCSHTTYTATLNKNIRMSIGALICLECENPSGRAPHYCRRMLKRHLCSLSCQWMVNCFTTNMSSLSRRLQKKNG